MFREVSRKNLGKFNLINGTILRNFTWKVRHLTHLMLENNCQLLLHIGKFPRNFQKLKKKFNLFKYEFFWIFYKFFVIFSEFSSMGSPVARSSYANLYINNQFYGLYYIIEDVNKVRGLCCVFSVTMTTKGIFNLSIWK